MQKIEFLSLRHKNISNEIEPCVLKNTRTLPILDDKYSWQACVQRFSLDTNIISCYGPKILTGPPNYFSSSDLPLVSRPAYTNPNPYLTDLEIVIESQFGYCSMMVEWFPYCASYIPPSVINDQTVLSSQYFQSYSSLHLCTLIELTLNKLFHAFSCYSDDCQFTKNNTQYMLLLPCEFFAVANPVPLRVSWNGQFNDLFGFDTSQHVKNRDYQSLNIDLRQAVPVSIGYPVIKNYIPISTGFLSSYLFPWVSVKFVSMDLQLRALKKMTNVNDQSNASEQIITDYEFQVTNVDEIYNRTYFSPEITDRYIDIIRTYDSDTIKISVFLCNDNNVSVPFFLDRRRSASMLIKFIGTLK